MFKSVFVGTLKSASREKFNLFWSLAFPLLMATLFHLAFANIYSSELIKEPIQVAYVSEQAQNPLYQTRDILSEIKLSDNTTPLFAIKDSNLEDGRQMVIDKKAATVLVDGVNPEIIANEAGAKQVVVKQVTDAILRTKNTVTNLAVINPLQNLQKVAQDLNSQEFTKKVPLNKELMKPDIIFYYALLAMTCLGASTAGAIAIISQQAKNSAVGARTSVSPTSKRKRVLAAGLSSFMVQVLMVLVVFCFMALVLNKGFGSHWPAVLLNLALGTLIGILVGMAVASLVPGSENAIIGMNTGVYLFSSFLAGLMNVEIKNLIEKAVPIIKHINPATLVVDGLYSLYYYDRMDVSVLINMLVMCLVLGGLVLVSQRRDAYVSL